MRHPAARRDGTPATNHRLPVRSQLRDAPSSRAGILWCVVERSLPFLSTRLRIWLYGCLRRLDNRALSRKGEHRRPPATGHCHRPPATGHRPPATGHRPTATGHRPPATGHYDKTTIPPWSETARTIVQGHGRDKEIVVLHIEQSDEFRGMIPKSSDKLYYEYDDRHITRADLPFATIGVFHIHPSLGHGAAKEYLQNEIMPLVTLYPTNRRTPTANSSMSTIQPTVS